MNTNPKMNKYTVKFTLTVEVEAEDAIDAVEKAKTQSSLDDAYIYVYVDGNLC